MNDVTGSIVMGTLVLWGLTIFGSLPLATVLSRGKRTLAPAGAGEFGTVADGKDQGEIPVGSYILADVIVLGIGGLLISMYTGYFFLGFSLRARDWPGIAAFIAASMYGAAHLAVR